VRLKLNAVRNLYPKKEKEKKSRATPHKGNLGQGPSTHLSQGRNSRGGVGGLGPTGCYPNRTPCSCLFVRL